MGRRHWRTALLAAAVGALCSAWGGGGYVDAPSSGKSGESADGGGGQGKSEQMKSEQVAAPGIPGKFTDIRDGYEYKTVKIGNQVWMAENLRFKIEGSWCYKNSDDSCGKYGRLYDWKTAKRVCPKGWHLPSNNEWEKLVTAVGLRTAGKRLKSASGWIKNGGGTDDFGFSALPGGEWYDQGFYWAGEAGHWWTASEDNSGDLDKGSYGSSRQMRSGDDYEHLAVSAKRLGFSVRCVQY